MTGSWETVAAAARKFNGTIKLPVCMAISSASSKTGRRVWITLRPLLLPGAAAWLLHNQRVALQLGRGEFHGQLRIAPSASGGHTLRRANNSKSTGTVFLVASELLTLCTTAAGRSRAQLEADWTDDWVEFTLPAFALPRAVVAPGAAPSNTAPSNTAPSNTAPSKPVPSTPVLVKPAPVSFTDHIPAPISRAAGSPIPMGPAGAVKAASAAGGA